MTYNPYQTLYRKRNIRVGTHSNVEDAEDLLRQLGFIYNPLGEVMKDVTKLLSYKYPKKVSRN